MIETMGERAIAFLIAFGLILPLTGLLMLLVRILSEFFKGVLYFVWAILKGIVWNVSRRLGNKKGFKNKPRGWHKTRRKGI